nr:MAG TPA: hypothetical protein [Caudoviricetes sp.]
MGESLTICTHGRAGDCWGIRGNNPTVKRSRPWGQIRPEITPQSSALTPQSGALNPTVGGAFPHSRESFPRKIGNI